MKQPHQNETTYPSVDMLALELGISRALAYRAIREGRIPSIRLGKRFIIPRSAIKTWLERAGTDFRPAA